MSRTLPGAPICVGLAVIALAGACRGRAASGPSSPAGDASETGKGALIPAKAADVLDAVRQSRGKVVLVNVWATWCEPCKEEFPALLRLDRELRGKGFKLILVSADFPDLRPQVERFLADHAVDFPTFLKDEPDDQFISALEPRWSGALPATILFDPSGARRQFWEGKSTYDVLVARVGALLAAGARGPSGASGREHRSTLPS